MNWILYVAGYVAAGCLCYAVGLYRGLHLGAVVTSKLLNDGWLVRGPKWPKPGQNVEERIEELHGG